MKNRRRRLDALTIEPLAALRRPLALAGAIAVLASCSTAGPSPMTTVSAFDPTRYVGEWRQIATIPAWFQRRCVANTMATYALVDGEQLDVINTCDTADGERIDAHGRARFTAPVAEGRLEVTFLKAFGAWLWFASGEYWVLRLGPDYEWSLVGHPSRNYAWVLARAEELDDATLAAITQALADEGYDPCRLVLTTPARDGRLCDVTDADADTASE